LGKVQAAIEKTVRNACLFANRIVAQGGITLSVVFDGDLPLLAHANEESKMWYHSYH
jgi:hypothetical protein